MKLSDRDWELSMRLSRRGKEDKDGVTLRSLLVHRLRLGGKAILRIPLTADIERGDRQSIYCEPCARWFPVEKDGSRFNCPDCDRMFIMEFAIFTQVL